MSDFDYAQKLRDPRWQQKRLEVLGLYDSKCQLCDFQSDSNHVHHKRYIGGLEPWEYENTALTVVCAVCHRRHHKLTAPNPFVKLIRGETTGWLLSHHPKAYLLLTLMALRARRTIGSNDHLTIGESLIGDYQSCGMSQMEYRTAKKTLAAMNLATFRSTSRGTIAKILDDSVFDINPEGQP